MFVKEIRGIIKKAIFVVLLEETSSIALYKISRNFVLIDIFGKNLILYLIVAQYGELLQGGIEVLKIP
ncbi:hypothetical protein [Raineya orbicola]|jgi:hypothetical protein|uniref:Uncharacterized protein n=1 Tax=Raineya orbicola TaxID=2016530 RepID=A0A2N3I7C1_9BACT|nr:hypothetical protein [Raineya orbicola]PKQ66196.1 hypothetical protein Rain11_2434 [Raineya orbicola]